MDNEERITMLREMPVPQLLIKMGLPTMIGMLVTGLYSIVDACFVGGLGTQQMGAISVVFPVGQILSGLGLLFGGGASSYISRLLGAGDRKQANHVASTALYSSLAIGVIATLVIEIFMRNILLALGATETILPFAVEYSSIFALGAIFTIISTTLNNVLTSEGAAKLSMIAMLLGAVLNVVLDPLLIYTFHLGIKGAAIATVVSQAITTLIYLSYLFTGKSVFTFSPKEFRVDGKIFGQIFKVGVPNLIFQLFTSLAMWLTTRMAQNYGDAAIAAMGIVTRMMAMGTLAVFGFMKGFQPVVGYNYGAKQYNRLWSAIKVTGKWSTIFCGVMTAILFLFPQAIISLFSNDATVLEIGANALRVNSILFVFFGIGTEYALLYLALGKSLGGLILSIGRQGLFFVPTILILPHYFELNGVILAQPIADVFTLISIIILATKINREIKGLLPVAK